MAHSDFTHEDLTTHVHYNPETGVFTRIKRWKVRGRGRVGDTLGSVDAQTGYRKVAACGQTNIRAGRLAWFYMTGEWPAEYIDHINGNRDDNRFANLQEATATENARNCHKRHDNKSGVPGVRWKDKDQRWLAKIGGGKNPTHLGSFVNREDAIKARRAAERERGYLNAHATTTSPYTEQDKLRAPKRRARSAA